jgi:curved DNA-binding protein
MSRGQLTVAQQAACIVLGVSPGAGEHELRAAFREAAKIAHPDRPGGDAARFRAVLDAYHLLQGKGDAPSVTAPAVAEPEKPPPELLTISPRVALAGGSVLSPALDGKRIRLTLPEGLRQDDLVRAGNRYFRIAIVEADEMQVRGNDVWLTAAIEPQVLEAGGKVSVDTPLGRRIVWLTERAGERGLVRLPGQGLPARSGHPRGDMFLRLEPAAKINESSARALLRRFAAAWAA